MNIKKKEIGVLWFNWRWVGIVFRTVNISWDSLRDLDIVIHIKVIPDLKKFQTYSRIL